MRRNIKVAHEMKTLSKLRYRHGIGEWYGKIFTKLSAQERVTLAKLQFLPKKDRDPQICPFRSSPSTSVLCNKDGGICTLRLYESDSASDNVRVAPGEMGSLVSICPNRFQQDGAIYSWISEVLLGHSNPLVVSEIGFLERRPEPLSDDRTEQTEDVGRIDNVLICPDSNPMTWCALEIQAVYFSGSSMRREFDGILKLKNEQLPFPSGQRRPDYRSSGPKRLMPQLQIKVPTLRRWGKKMAVVVDRPFFNSLGKMDDLKEVSNSDIAWFIVKYEEVEGKGAVLKRDGVRFTTLERAVEGLTGGLPVGLAEFESRIASKLGAKH